MTGFSSVLIANRGEIACRIARTARRMGIESVAVYSDADAHAMHVAAADRAVHIGPAPPRESYLNIPRIIEAARRSGAQAIHPGYGFLSEQPAFVEACDAAGLIFIGPPASAMRAMGSKSAAKALMETSDVPVLPGYHGPDQNPDTLASHAARIGYPLVIKAVAGGGGRGMRVVHAAEDFAAALASARQEGASSFGDDRVLIERYLQRPRHIEVQVFADTHGNAVHLFERDCSAQRRHQKVIEEAPAPGIDPARRTAMGLAAVNAARAVGYVGAGTVEFVADDAGFFFLEMNTRLQVEHPVTEAITGYDLVEWQFRVAAGEKLPATQDEIHADGHAIEVRLYAEDPARNFAPSIGKLSVFRTPPAGEGVRIDTGFTAGDSISIHYDAMIAKLIVHDTTRADAIRRMSEALTQCDIAGVASNLDLLARLVAHPDFAAGAVDTGFIERHADTLLTAPPPPPPQALAAAVLGLLAAEADAAAASSAASGDPYSPWAARDGWWLNAAPARVFAFTADDGGAPVTATPAAGAWRLQIGDTSILGRAVHKDGVLIVDLDGMREPAGVTRAGEFVHLRFRGQTWRLRLPDPAAAADEDTGAGGRLVAPIPGQVTQVLAAPGDTVTRGQTLVVLEAMKTVFRLGAPADGVVAAVSCRAGETVEEGALLVAFEEG